MTSTSKETPFQTPFHYFRALETFKSGKEAVKKNAQKNKAGRRIVGLVSIVQSFLLHLTFSWQYLLLALMKTPEFLDQFTTHVLRDKQGKFI